MFPYGKGDITKPRIGRNPTLGEYFFHLMRIDRAFAEHHAFKFVACNMLRRHQALTLGNVFAKHSADNLSMKELKTLVDSGNDKVIKKLLYFSAPIKGSRQYLRYKGDQAISLVKFVRIESDDTEMFNYFQTFSAADLHWDDLHRILTPDSLVYMNKRLVDSLDDVDEEDRENCIEKTLDIKLRIINLKKHQDIIDFYFYNRIQALIKHVLPVIGVKDYIIRYEIQGRGTMHAHLLIRVGTGPSHIDLKNAYMVANTLPLAFRQTVLDAQAKIVKFSTQVLGISSVHPNSDPIEWPGPYGQNVHTPESNCLRKKVFRS